jgi:hypothetical protein
MKPHMLAKAVRVYDVTPLASDQIKLTKSHETHIQWSIIANQKTMIDNQARRNNRRVGSSNPEIKSQTVSRMYTGATGH